MNRMTAPTYERYTPGDETLLSVFHNRAYQSFAGVVHRTPEHWVWSCIERPGMQPEGVIVARIDQEVVGYVAVSDTGVIWDLVVAEGPNRGSLADGLLSQAETYARAAGASRLVVNIPHADDALRRAVSRADFGPLDRSNMYLTIHDYPRLLGQLGEGRRLPNVGVRFTLRRKNRPDTIFVMAGREESTELIEVRADGLTFDRVVLGTTSLAYAMLTGRIHIRPLGKTPAGYRFLRHLRVGAEWFAPLGDVL